MVIAYYRCLYGEDFIRESVESVLHLASHVFIFLNTRPWGDARSCVYRGQTIYFPHHFDALQEIVHDMRQLPQVHVVNLQLEPNNHAPIVLRHLRWSGFEPHQLLFMEPDMVWRKQDLDLLVKEQAERQLGTIIARQVELWRRLDWRTAERHGRAASMLMNVDRLDEPPQESVTACVHNAGFCVSDRNMFWKHMTGLGFSAKIGDCVPNEDWFEKKWLTWHPTQNNRDLEISLGAEKNLPYAEPYDVSQLPAPLKEGYDQGRWPWMIGRLG